MARCEVCDNEYDKAFRVVTASGEEHTFDSVEADGRIFCCAHCAQLVGVGGLADRA